MLEKKASQAGKIGKVMYVFRYEYLPMLLLLRRASRWLEMVVIVGWC